MDAVGLSLGRDLRAYAAALISAASRREVGRAFATTGVAAAGASGGSLSVARHGSLHRLTVCGTLDEDRVASLSANAVLAEVFRTLTSTWLETSGDEAWAVLPLLGDGGPLGVVALQFAGPHAFGPDTPVLGWWSPADPPGLRPKYRGTKP